MPHLLKQQIKGLTELHPVQMTPLQENAQQKRKSVDRGTYDNMLDRDQAMDQCLRVSFYGGWLVTNCHNKI